MSDNAVILLSGKQGSGKSTHARAIVDELTHRNYVVFPMKFAATLYQIHDEVRRILREKGIDDLKSIDGPLLQLLGTEWGRKTRGEDIWVKAALSDVERFTMKVNQAGKRPVFVFDDCRFPNELAAWGTSSLRIRLDAPETVRMVRAEKWRANVEHPSEIALDDLSPALFSHTILTIGDKDTTRQMIVNEAVIFCHRTIGLP